MNDVLALPRYACVDYGKMQGAFDAMDKMTDNAELDGQQLVVHSFMPKPDECIPADESTEIDVVIDSVSGKLSKYHSAALRSLPTSQPRLTPSLIVSGKHSKYHSAALRSLSRVNRDRRRH